MQARIPTLPLRTYIVGILLSCLSFSLLFAGNFVVAHAQTVTPTGIVLVPGTVVLGDNVNNAILAALEGAVDLFPHMIYFAVTDWRQDGSWAIASVVGLSRLRNGNAWSVDDGTWVGIVLLEQLSGGAWQGATQGTKSFSSLLGAVPNSFLDPTARRNLDPLNPAGMQALTTAGYIFPLQPGTLMYYGGNGVHANGFSGVVSGWKAVDLMSDGDTTQNHAPNRLIASETATISYVCNDGHSVAVKMGDFFYTHLIYNDKLFEGSTFNQGDYMGKLKTGTFNAGCGYADQGSNWFHVHWGFPNANLHVENWTLSMSTGNWTDGTATVTPNHWFLSAPTPPTPANLRETSATQNTINFAWDASSGADGYYLYSWNGSAYVRQDTLLPSQTTYTEMRGGCGWNELYEVTAYNDIGKSPRAGPLRASAVPCDPSPLSPADGSVHVWNYDLTFQSNPATGAASYLMEYWGGPYSTPQTCGWSSTASCHVGPLPDGKTYSWHVKARNIGGETGWSATWSFTTQPIPCDTLDVAHTGSGGDPTVDPLKSTGCTSGQYHPGEQITLTSAPDTGWTVGSWSGTDHDSSTALSNSLTMPDGNSTATVNYTPIVPAVPVLVSPANGATRRPLNLTLDWKAASGAVSYEYCLNTSSDCTTWVPTGSATSAALSRLSLGTHYYWKVRATNEYGNTSQSVRWSFTTGNKPGSFAKSSPANRATGQPAGVSLQWAASSTAAEYQYCIDTTNDGACQGGNWVSTGANRSADLSGQLSVHTTYYWQVRALNSFGVTPANDGWWSFTTSAMPGAFLKKTPASSSTKVPLQPTLNWTASPNATGYAYCIDQTDDGACDGDRWITLRATTSRTLYIPLHPLTTYYWQVRALNGFGTATSDGDAWWSFTTGDPPAAFGKIGPADALQDQRLTVNLSWAASARASSYQYCLSTTNGACNSWVSTGTATSAKLSKLAQHTTYYWQVRAMNAIGATASDAALWWSFTTGYLPSAFSKVSPGNGATNIGLSPTLSWNASVHAASYQYCLSTMSTCSTWNNVDNQTSIALSGLKPSTLYYWQVRARSSIGVTNASGGLWSFHTGSPPRAFLKSAPASGALDQPASVTLTWNASTGATKYQYCIDTVDDKACQNQHWVGTGRARSVDLSSLSLAPNTVYYWQVRAINRFGKRAANNGVWWSFTTRP